MCILEQKEKGWKIIDEALKKGGNGEIKNVLYVFEMILCFDAWINKATFWSSNDNETYKEIRQKSIIKMMRDIKKYLP